MSRTCLALLSVATLAACGDSGRLLSPAPATPRASAAVTTTRNFDTPYRSKVFVPCANGGAGEKVESVGTIHRLIHITANDNSFHITLHANPQDVTGTGLTTGDTYQTRGTFNAHENDVLPGVTESIRDAFKLVGPGPDNNFTIVETYHLTINNNGEPVVDTEEFSIECS
ncbi:MAG: hypothetical protein JO306_06835 [Gemmatimonadetes bacterium]|nr:hypothetical protein [Gemmatimonadota bacterium]